jgi:hypothetical protein
MAKAATQVRPRLHGGPTVSHGNVRMGTAERCRFKNLPKIELTHWNPGVTLYAAKRLISRLETLKLIGLTRTRFGTEKGNIRQTASAVSAET